MYFLAKIPSKESHAATMALNQKRWLLNFNMKIKM